MDKIKLSKSVKVSADTNGKYYELHQQFSEECSQRFSNYAIGNQENLLKHVLKDVILTIELKLSQFVKGFLQNKEVTEEVIIGRSNRKIDLSLMRIELLKVDSKFEKCEFMLHFVSSEYYFKTFVGNSVIISPLYDGFHTIMVDLDDKQIAVEYLDSVQNSTATAV